MKKWGSASNYLGPNYSDFYILVSQNRDSGILGKSNFACALQMLGGESDSVKVLSFGHWGCGWIEAIGIHESDKAAIAIAEDIERALADYPVLDDEDYSNRQLEYCAEYWDSCGIDERMDYCKDERIAKLSWAKLSRKMDCNDYCELQGNLLVDAD